MDQTADQIRHDIEARRTRLVEDVNEFESRVRQTVSFHEQFHRHTGAILGGAMAGGLLLGLMLGGRSDHS